MTLTLDQGRTIVSIARERLDSFVRSGGVEEGSENGEAYMRENRGVFVTLNMVGSGVENLRGCIGIPYPVKQLGSALLESAIAAASEDPRFPPVTSEELDSVVVEVSVLTVPQELKVAKNEDIPSQIQIGKDGLIVSDEFHSGLLLPQVATEFSLGASDFLSAACMKAGLLPDAWLTGGVSVKKFQAEIFAEERPHGPVRRLMF